MRIYGAVRVLWSAFQFTRMLDLLLLAGLLSGTLGGPSEHHSRHLAPRQASYTKYINGTANNANPVELDINVNSGGRNETSAALYGWMFEDISVSRDRLTFNIRRIQYQV